jgi:hypothetical protein
MPLLFHRWFTRPGPRWVLAALVSLALVSAQVLAARHELSHLFGGAAASEWVADAESPPAGNGRPEGGRPESGHPEKNGHPGSVQAGHECPLCLLAAALGGTAAGPQGLIFSAAEATAPGPLAAAHTWVPRFTRAYASRAPPLA